MQGKRNSGASNVVGCMVVVDVLRAATSARHSIVIDIFYAAAIGRAAIAADCRIG